MSPSRSTVRFWKRRFGRLQRKLFEVMDLPGEPRGDFKEMGLHLRVRAEVLQEIGIWTNPAALGHYSVIWRGA